MSTLRIHLFGKFSVQRLELLLDGFDAHKPQELLCYSSLLRTLAIISWSEIITAQSKKNLPHTLLHLQSERYTPSSAEISTISALRVNLNDFPLRPHLGSNLDIQLS